MGARKPPMMAGFQAEETLTGRAPKKCAKKSGRYPELRYDSTSTIFCTLYKQEDWLMRLGGGARAESIIERYSHNVIRIEIGDENMRDIFGSRKTT